LQFLNNSGNVQSVISRLKSAYGGNFTDVFYQDITGDSVPDLMFMDFQQFHRFNVFVCKEGAYHLFVPETEPDFEKVIEISDLNANGIKEIILSAGFCTGSGCTSFYVYEWNGETFNNLALDMGISGLEKFEIKDIDRNGVKDIILVGGILGTGGYQLQVPARTESHVYKWNGTNYAPEPIEKSSPNYRFQAIQDADQFVLNGQINVALSLYQDAIFSDNLSWWSPQRQQYFIVMDPWRDPNVSFVQIDGEVQDSVKKLNFSNHRTSDNLMDFIITGNVHERKHPSRYPGNRSCHAGSLGSIRQLSGNSSSVC